MSGNMNKTNGEKREVKYRTRSPRLENVVPTRERSRDFSYMHTPPFDWRVGEVTPHSPTEMTTSPLQMPYEQQAEGSSLPLRMASTFSCKRNVSLVFPGKWIEVAGEGDSRPGMDRWDQWVRRGWGRP